MMLLGVDVGSVAVSLALLDSAGELPVAGDRGHGRAPRETTGVSVVSLTYDGTGAPHNDRILPYLRYPRSSCR